MNRRIERYRGGRGYGRPHSPRESTRYPGRPGSYGGGSDWPDEVWSGEGPLDEGWIGQARGYGSSPYGQRAYRQGPYGPRREESGYAHGEFGRDLYGQDLYGWTEYDEPRYVGSLYRGERRGEEMYREHEWQRSKEPPHLLERVFARGPKGYTRSDERIKEDVSEQLWRADHIDSSEVSVTVGDGVVALSGTVPERWMRLELESIADNCMGVQDIDNNIRVLRRMTAEGEVEASGTNESALGGPRAGP